MRKTIIALVFGSVFLSACTQLEILPPDQVLSKAQKRNQELMSVLFDVSGTFEYSLEEPIGVGGGTAIITGKLQDGGKQVYAKVDTNITSQRPEGATELHALFESIVVTPGETYVKVHELASVPQHPLLAPDLLNIVLKQWWTLPRQTQQGPDMSLTPKPQLLKAQSEVVRVVDDFGIDRLRKRRAYHLGIEVDPQKLQAFLQKLSQEREEENSEAAFTNIVEDVSGHGELWVDAETFDTLRIQWTITSLPFGGEASAALSFTMDFTEHNSALPITIPEDTRPFTMEVEVLEEGGGAKELFPSKWEEELIDKLLGD